MTVAAELQIHEVRSATATEVTVVVRCLSGPVRLGARFSLVRDTRAPIDLAVTSIVRYHRPDPTVDPGHSALVTLRGTGARELLPTIGQTGREVMAVVQGDNPAAS
ncbi:hypothetical protein ACIF85_29000 [Streptomyces sp. NPDC086033]|uniref:hypothetical protein n=1 Tax=unclassified Streptomyces TaxID=2593676 RepID=UPI000B2BFE6E|nr:hypothetical protein [Streptomyces sp. LUP47B]